MDSRTFEAVETHRRSRRALLSDFHPRAIAWLALAPGWPVRVATRGFPTSEKGLSTGSTVTEQFERAVVSGLIESRNSFYAMNRIQTANAIQWLTGSGGVTEEKGSPRWSKDDLLIELLEAVAQMRAQAFQIAKEIDNEEEVDMEAALTGEAALPPALSRWVELVDQKTLNGMAIFFLGKIESEIRISQEAKLTSCPGAARWIETAQRVSNVFEGPLEMAVASAERQRELFYRDSRDEKHLENYRSRKGAEEAVTSLVNGPDTQWALHYLGVGGTGKTMLLRHIQVRLAKKLKILTARVDFDSLNPDFPLHAPGLLLLALARELALRADQEITTRLDRFKLSMNNVHRTLEGRLAEGLDVQAGISAEGFEQALDSFAQTLGALPSDIHPVLILDTCEELARLRPDGTLPGNVEATFDILEKLHDKLRSLRVIFAGRRPLAHEGDGWVSDASKLPDRPYLRVYRIQGFDDEEARGFLKDYRRDGNPVLSEFWEAILERSGSVKSSGFEDIRLKEENDETRPVTSYNPYDLSLYAAWAATDKGLTIEALRTSSVHFFVKERIMGRVHPTLQPWVHFLTALERFDKALVQNATRLDDDETTVIWEEIRALEWTEPDRQAISAEVQAIDRNLLGRLRKYFAEEQKGLWTEARQRALEVLREATLQRPFRELTPSYFGVALRLHNPVSATEWLALVERKVSEAQQ
jgi:hypothetical protein